MPGVAVDLTELGSERLRLEGEFEPGAIDFSSEDVRQVQPLVWSGWIEREGSRIRFVGELRTEIELACVRCLVPVSQPVGRRFDLFFEPRGDFMYEENAEIELNEQETQTAFFVGNELQVGDVMREQVLLSLPMKPLCQPDCRGLCPMCGQDLNAASCGCTAPSLHPAFEVLAGLKERPPKQGS